jgi:hypothetical protein
MICESWVSPPSTPSSIPVGSLLNSCSFFSSFPSGPFSSNRCSANSFSSSKSLSTVSSSCACLSLSSGPGSSSSDSSSCGRSSAITSSALISAESGPCSSMPAICSGVKFIRLGRSCRTALTFRCNQSFQFSSSSLAGTESRVSIPTAGRKRARTCAKTMCVQCV